MNQRVGHSPTQVADPEYERLLWLACWAKYQAQKAKFCSALISEDALLLSFYRIRRSAALAVWTRPHRRQREHRITLEVASSVEYWDPAVRIAPSTRSLTWRAESTQEH